MGANFIDGSKLSTKELESGSAFTPNFGAGGLVTAIAVEATRGDILMLAHMNAEALRRTFETGYVHYFSRSRNEIWKKGETSGETQKLVEIRVDCDQDALILLVEMVGQGAACHTGRRSCFFRRVIVRGDDLMLEDVGTEKLFDPAEVYKGS